MSVLIYEGNRGSVRVRGSVHGAWSICHQGEGHIWVWIVKVMLGGKVGTTRFKRSPDIRLAISNLKGIFQCITKIISIYIYVV